MTQAKFSLFTDGGARGNPGPSGAGAVIKNKSNQTVFKISEYLGDLTNNQAEYQALILGLNKAKKEGITSLDCFLDSELIVKQLNGDYRVKDAKLKEVFALVAELLKNFDNISFKHIRREKNKEADMLVNKALDKALKS
ncbi:ribonuclease HI family protein [Patescibacteria group bacterium]|nr:ribonuclease HI family protein [Patescibacteria group bacterium]